MRFDRVTVLLLIANMLPLSALLVSCARPLRWESETLGFVSIRGGLIAACFDTQGIELIRNPGSLEQKPEWQWNGWYSRPSFYRFPIFDGVVYLLGIPGWLLMCMTILPTAFILARRRKYGASQCRQCGYDLRGTPGSACSECGTPFGTQTN